ncbi:hypothetical protein LRS12_03605 [Sphingomonas sp. J344]|uniref:hypothetical protein n=1 Tax=Sphingomonas sp. J344 TaxID=2898434 RepID=UPI002150B442|nr:hypothetical protein [Sphingomonas sp. J344]MCR5869914.1 hypothetical protein [Sphingomonas sp. J344]
MPDLSAAMAMRPNQLRPAIQADSGAVIAALAMRSLDRAAEQRARDQIPGCVEFPHEAHLSAWKSPRDRDFAAAA